MRIKGEKTAVKVIHCLFLQASIDGIISILQGMIMYGKLETFIAVSLLFIPL